MDLRARFEDFGEVNHAFRVLTKFHKMDGNEIHQTLNILQNAYDLDFGDLYSDFFDRKIIYEDEGLKSAPTALQHLFYVQEDYGSLYRLYSILVGLPYSTTECQQGFSTMNDIKSDTRNRLGDTLFDLNGNRHVW